MRKPPLSFAMPSWISSYVPPALRNLPTPVRRKAIELASGLVREGYEEGTAFRVALAQAREWAAHGGASRKKE
jgi:uncharacterized protein YdaT